MNIQLQTGRELSFNTDVLEQGLKDYELLLHTIIADNMKKYEDTEIKVEELLKIVRSAVWDEIEHIVDNEIQNHTEFLKCFMILACTREYYNLLDQSQQTSYS